MHPLDGPIADCDAAPDRGAERRRTPRIVAPSAGRRSTASTIRTADPRSVARGRRDRDDRQQRRRVRRLQRARAGLTFGDFRATTTARRHVRSRLRHRARAARDADPADGRRSRRCSTSSTGCTTSGTTPASPRPRATRRSSNYGRGGDEGDAILAEAQDNALGGSRNNANMSTPDDGLPPRMQVFLWSGKDERTLHAVGEPHAARSAPPRSARTTFDVDGARSCVGERRRRRERTTDGCTRAHEQRDRQDRPRRSRQLHVQDEGAQRSRPPAASA